jgi:cation:H+ antiporter
MSGGVLAIPGLLIGVLLAFAGGEALTRGARALLAGAAGLAGFAAVLATVMPELAFAMRASALDLPGAAVGAVAGSLTANALIGSVIAATAVGEPVRGARTFTALTALGAAALIVAAFDGTIGQTEGGLMLLAALFTAWRSARMAADPSDALLKSRPGPGLLWIVLGAVLIVGGAWLALEAVASLAAGRSEGDLIAGLTALGLGAALPEIAAAAVAARKGEGAQGFVNVATGTALVLFGALGAATLVRPLRVSDAFLGAPVIAVATSALVLLGIGLVRRRLPKAAAAVGLVAYLGFLGAFLAGVG